MSNNNRPKGYYDNDDRSAKGYYDNGPKKSGKLRAIKIACIVGIVALGLVSTFLSVYHQIVSNMTLVDDKDNQSAVDISDIEELNVSGSDEIEIPEGVIMTDKDVHVILLVGSDYRLGTDKYAKSDTMMLVVLDRVHKKVKLISIMRDLYAPIKGHGSNKINYAYAYDSASGNLTLETTRNTIENCFGVHIDNIVVVNFRIFRIFIDRLGGMDIELTRDQARYMCWQRKWSSPENKGRTEAGVYHMNGAECLAYCRMRYVGNGDFDRTKHQRDFLEMVVQKLKSKTYLELAKLIKDALPEITTDLSEGEILGFAFEAPDLMKYEFVQLSFPVEGSYKFGWTTIGVTNVSVLLTDYNFCRKAIQGFIYDDDMTYVNGGKATGCVFPAVSTIPPSTESTEEAETTTAPSTDPTTTTTQAAAPADGGGNP